MSDTQEKARILICDDEVIIAADLASRLKNLGYTICAQATSGEGALELVEEHQPDLVMMDIVLQGEMDGIDAAEVIRDKWGIPVVFLTAYADTDRLERAKLTYPFGYLLKPFQDRDLKITTEMALYVAKVDGERKKTEDALRRSQIMLSRTEEIASVGSWEWEIKEDKVKWSDELFRIFGMEPRDEAPNWAEHNSLQLYHPDDLLELGRAAELAIKDGTPYQMELRANRRDGETRICLSNGFPERGPTGQIERLFGSIQDITDFRFAENKLEESEEKYRLLFESITDGAFVLDYEWRYIGVNNVAANIVGVSKSDLIGSKITDIFVGIEQTEFFKTYERVMNSRVPESVINEFAHTDGNKGYYEVYVYPCPIGILCIARDITDRKKTEIELIESESFYRLILSSINDSVFLTTEEGSLVYICPNVHHIFGYAEGEVRKMGNISGLIGINKSEIQKMIVHDEMRNIEKQITDKNSKKHSLLVSVQRVSIGQGTLLWICRDISERKYEEEELRKYKHIVSSTQDGISYLDQNYRYQIVNDAYERFSGKDRNEFLGLTISEYLGEKIFEEEIKPQFDRCLRGETINYQIWFNYPNLGRKYVDVTYYPYINSEGKIDGIVANTRDATDRYQAEATLRESEIRFRGLIENLPDIILRFDTECRHLYVSPSVGKVVDIPPEQFVGKTHRELGFSEAQCEYWEKCISKVFKTQSIINEEFVFEGTTGKIYFDWRLVPEYGLDGSVQSVMSISRDVTDRRLSEQALKESEERFRTIFNSFPHYLALWKKTDDDFVLHSVNTASIELSESKIQNFIGCSMSDFYKNSPWIKGAIEECFNTKKTINGENVYKFQSIDIELLLSFYFVHLPNGYVLVAAENITDRKQAEDALLESEKLFKAFFNQSFQFAILLDTDGTALRINSLCYDVCGKLAENVVGSPFWEAGWWVEFYEVQDKTKKGLKTALDGEVYSDEVRFRDKDNKVRNGIRIFSPIYNIDGLIQYISVVGLDISARMRIESDLKKMVHEKETLLKELNHRVKNNMQVIISLMRLQSDKTDDKQLKNSFLETQNRIYAMSTVHETLHQSENLSSVDLAEYLSKLSETIYHTYRSNAGKVLFSTEIKSIPVDLEKSYPIGLVINELLSNSLKYAFPGGKAGEIDISGQLEGNTAKLVLSDTGVGIPQDLNWRNTESLGLQIVRSLVEDQLQGTIDLDRTQGTKWTITFPVSMTNGETR